MTRLFIIRHGNTFAPGEVVRRVGAGTDIPLAESGRTQISALADALRDRGIAFAALFCGPLTRTRESAALLAAGTGIAREVDTLSFLNEIDHGPDEGKPEDAVQNRVGEDALEAWDRDGTAPDGWIVDAKERVAGWLAFFTRALTEWPDGDVALVTSNGAARFALEAIDADRVWPQRKLRTGAAGIIELAPEVAPSVSAWDVRPRQLAEAIDGS